jgi:hypothetical protein
MRKDRAVCLPELNTERMVLPASRWRGVADGDAGLKRGPYRVTHRRTLERRRSSRNGHVAVTPHERRCRRSVYGERAPCFSPRCVPTGEAPEVACGVLVRMHRSVEARRPRVIAELTARVVTPQA